MAKKKSKSDSEIDYEKFGWQTGDIIHSRDISPRMWALLTDEEKWRFERMGYVNGIAPDWASLTDEQKKQFESWGYVHED